MDKESLIVFSIIFLVMERFIDRFLEMLEHLIEEIHAKILQAERDEHGNIDISTIYDSVFVTKLSVGIGLLSFFFLLFAVLIHSTSTRRSQLIDVISMAGLFSLDCVQTITVLLLIGHTTAVPTGDAQQWQLSLGVLLGVWVASMVGSQVLRRQLYRRLGS